VDVVERPSGWYVPLVWSLSPHDTAQGRLLRLGRDGDAFVRPVSVISDLPRPVHAAYADLNGDGREDVLTCGFGNVNGAFSWWENTGTGLYAEHVLLDRAGATRCEVADLNGDGRPDVVVQMAQAREGLYWFENLGGGRFEPHVIQEFHPLWGSASFQLVDFNRDGQPDLLVANGDNGEYRSPLKPYHGVRLYLNDGRNRFREAYFFPMNGAYKALAADFDGDGRLDIAAISYFPDYDGRRAESFVVLFNDGGMNFRARSVDEGMAGRWLVMDVGDLDGDGDPDIVLGAANRVPFKVPKELFAAWEERGPTLMILRNRLRP
jgi:hypothetical protein